MMRRKHSKANIYRELFAQCMIKGCTEPAQETHHIVPLSKSGKDTFANFICLCHDHHRHYKRHRDWQEQQEELFIHKFYNELSVLGFTSDVPESEFKHKIALWRVESGVSCPALILPQKPVRIEKKELTTHNNGQLKRVSKPKKVKPPKPPRKCQCHWCGKWFEIEQNKRKYCSGGCWQEADDRRYLIGWLYEIITNKENSPDKSRTIPNTLEPCTFLIPTSLNLLCVVKAARPNNPRQEMMMAKPAKYLESKEIWFSDSYKN